MLRLCLIVIAGLALPALAEGQSVQWLSNAKQGVSKAKSTGLPIMFYITGSRRDADDLKKAQDQAFRDPLVRAMVRERFIPVRLPLSTTTRDLLAQMNVPGAAQFSIVVATSKGRSVGIIGPAQIRNPRMLVQQMTTLFRKYRKEMFDTELKPKLEKADARPGDLIKALRVIDKFVIPEADETVAKLLERDKLTKTVKKEIYDTLATLSTQRSVEALLEVITQDKLAATALGKCTPAAAEQMLPDLDPERPGRFQVVYDAVTKICKIKGTKSQGFFQNKDAALINKEIERVKGEVVKAAESWRRRYEAYR